MLVDCVDLDALEREARRVMRPESWVFCDTGADDEITAKENVVAWRRLKLRPRMLRDIVWTDTNVTLLVRKLKLGDLRELELSRERVATLGSGVPGDE